MEESVFTSKEGSIFFRHQNLYKNQPVLILIHGLGESGLCFKEAFDSPELQSYAIIAPDLPGYGRSTQADSNANSFDAQIRRIRMLINDLGINTFIIMGHSLGADIASLMASTDIENRVQGLISIEGALTPGDTFFSSQIVAAAQRKDFTHWLETEFKEEMILKRLGRKWPSCRRYYVSLQFARTDAVLANAVEICKRAEPLKNKDENLLGRTYIDLKIPKVFCWGSESLSEETLEFLESHSLEHKKFEPAHHWPMIDQSEAFYTFVADFLKSIG